MNSKTVFYLLFLSIANFSIVPTSLFSQMQVESIRAIIQKEIAYKRSKGMVIVVGHPIEHLAHI